jgi:hypothetical protein
VSNAHALIGKSVRETVSISFVSDLGEKHLLITVALIFWLSCGQKCDSWVEKGVPVVAKLGFPPKGCRT